MKEKEFSKEEIEINYELIKKIEKHAREYEFESDKKSFLKNVCAYEQKYILMNSPRPYEVLKYLDELDLKSSRVILEELDYEEIKKIINLFTHEDKMDFYKTFSSLSLINQFIEKDEHAKEHIKKLSMHRKVELLNSTSLETIEAASIVYSSIPPKLREKVTDSLTNSNAISAINQTATYKEDKVIDKMKELHFSDEINDEVTEKILKEEIKEEIKENLKEEMQEEIKEQLKKEIKERELNEMKKEFFKNKLQHYIEKFPEIKDLDLEDENLFEKLSPELLSIIENDFFDQKEIKIQEKQIEKNVDNKYAKTNSNIDFLKNATINDFALRVNTIALFSELCKQDEQNLKKFEQNFPDLYADFSQYFGKPDAFNNLDIKEQNNIISKIQSNPILFSELNKGLEEIKKNLDSIKKALYDSEIDVFMNNAIKENPNILQSINIQGKKEYTEFTEDEKLRLKNYLSSNLETAKQLKQIGEELELNFGFESKCIKENASFSDLLLAVSDKSKFRTYLAKSLVGDDVLIDVNGNLKVSDQKPIEKNVVIDYEKYSIIGNGEKRVNLVKNNALLEDFKVKKQECETEEIDQLLNFEIKNQENEKTL